VALAKGRDAEEMTERIVRHAGGEPLNYDETRNAPVVGAPGAGVKLKRPEA
jgi:hypothetical protein